MTFTIHRGASEIGGSCVEINTSTTKIVIDFGMPLVNSDKTPFNSNEINNLSTEELIQQGILPNIPSLYKNNSTTAVLISHSHQDHYGLIDKISSSCPVYLGKITKFMIETLNTFTNKKWNIQNPKYIENGKLFKIGDIEITPFLLDHSAFESFAFFIEADGKSLLYSGDFRLHGRNEDKFNNFKDNVKQNVDYFLMEGSTLGRTTDTSTDVSYQTEKEIEEQFVKIFNQTNGINLIFTSGQNIERLISIYNACKKCDKIFLIDFYTAYILKYVNKYGNDDKQPTVVPFPSKKFPEIKVFFPTRLIGKILRLDNQIKYVYQFSRYNIGKNNIDKLSDKIVMLVRSSQEADLKNYLKKYSGGSFIYSMWKGYIEQNQKTKEFIEYFKNKGMSIKFLHTSGHADLLGLKKIIDTVKPKNIVPIHTYEGEKYKEYFNDYNVLIIKDKEEFNAMRIITRL